MQTITFNDKPIEDWRITVQKVRGHRSMVDQLFNVRPVPGREDALPLDTEGSTGPRRISIDAVQKADTLAELMAAKEDLLWYLHGREHQVRIKESPTRYITAKVEAVQITPIDPWAIQRGHQVQILLLAADPRWHADQLVEAVLDTTRTPVELGSAPSRPVVRIDGPVSNPVVIHRDSAGVEKARIELNATIGTGAAVIIDCDRMTITDALGTDLAYVWKGRVFLRLDPRHAGGPAGPWPTVELSGGTGTIGYRKAWL